MSKESYIAESEALNKLFNNNSFLFVVYANKSSLLDNCMCGIMITTGSCILVVLSVLTTAIHQSVSPIVIW